MILFLKEMIKERKRKRESTFEIDFEKNKWKKYKRHYSKKKYSKVNTLFLKEMCTQSFFGGEGRVKGRFYLEKKHGIRRWRRTENWRETHSQRKWIIFYFIFPFFSFRFLFLLSLLFTFYCLRSVRWIISVLFDKWLIKKIISNIIFHLK